MANSPSFIRLHTTPLFPSRQYLMSGYPTNFPTECQLSPQPAKVPGRDAEAATGLSTGLGSGRHSPSPSWLQSFPSAARARASVKSRTGIRKTDSFHSSVGHEDQATRRGMCSEARGFHGVRHCAVREREAKRGSGGPHPSFSVSVRPQPPSGAPGEGSKCGRTQTPQSLGQLGGASPHGSCKHYHFQSVLMWKQWKALH